MDLLLDFELCSFFDISQGFFCNNSCWKQSFHLPFARVNIGAHSSCPVCLFNCVRLCFQSMETTLMNLGFNMISKGMGVDEVFCAVNTIKLPKTCFVIVNILFQEVTNNTFAKVMINLVEILSPRALSHFDSPSSFQVNISSVILFTLVWTSHIADFS